VKAARLPLEGRGRGGHNRDLHDATAGHDRATARPWPGETKGACHRLLVIPSSSTERRRGHQLDVALDPGGAQSELWCIAMSTIQMTRSLRRRRAPAHRWCWQRRARTWQAHLGHVPTAHLHPHHVVGPVLGDAQTVLARAASMISAVHSSCRRPRGMDHVDPDAVRTPLQGCHPRHLGEAALEAE